MDYTQFKGRPFAVISKLGVRYTGIFDHISQEDQTICLSQVYNHGTEDRPTAKKLPGSATTLGWVRFHTESIESIALVENYVPPGGEQPVDPILASVSTTAPSQAAAAPPAPAPSAVPAAAAVAPAPSQAPVPAAASSSRSPLRHDLPSRPSGSANSAATALDRVQQSLSELSVNGGGGGGVRPRRQPYAPRAPGPAHPIEVPDTEFDFSKGTEALEAERTARKAAGGETGKGKGKSEDGDIETPMDEGEPELPPHPIAVQPASNGIGNGHGPDAATSSGAGPAGRKGSASGSSAYVKSSFFDTLSGESSRVSRAEERGRNYDTFGEAGGQEGAYGGRGRGGYGGARGGRGGYGRGGYSQSHGGHGQGGQGQYSGGGYNRGRGSGGVGGGYRGRGGYGQSQTQSSQAGAQQ